MTEGAQTSLDALDLLVGEWRMATTFAPEAAESPRTRARFEWLPGRRFLIQRWEVEHPEAPDGIAIIGLDPDTGRLLQHYFDSRGVARVYTMTFAANLWTLERRAAAPDFSQRFSGTLNASSDKIDGLWQRSGDGSSWSDDFALTYTRLS